MNIVVDTSAIIAVLINEDTKHSIIEATHETKLISSKSLPFEIGNAYSAMFKKRIGSLDEALRALKIFESIQIRYVDIDLEQSLKLAKELDIYAYDAYMIEVAQRFKAPIITLDKKLIEAAENIGIRIIRVR